MTRSEIIEKMIAARQSGDMADVLDVVESEWQVKVESARREGWEAGVRALDWRRKDWRDFILSDEAKALIAQGPKS